VLVVPPNPSAEELKATIMNRKVEFNISKYVHEGWVFVKHNICAFFGILFIILLVSIGVNVAYVGAIGIGNWYRFYTHSWEEDMHMELSPRNILITAAFAVGRSLLFTFPILASMYKAVFNAMRDNTKIRFADFFSAYSCPYWFRLTGLAMVFLFIAGVWLMLMPVFWPVFFPAFYFSLTFIFGVPFHVEHYSLIGIRKSLYFSFKIFNRYFCSMLGFLLLLGVMQLLGLLCFGVGLFVTVPVALVALCYCYHHLIGVNGVAVLVPSSHLEGVPMEVAVVAPVVPSVPQMPIASAPSATLV